MNCRTGLPTTLEDHSNHKATRHSYLPDEPFASLSRRRARPFLHQYVVGCRMGQHRPTRRRPEKTPEPPTTRRKPADMPDGTMDASYKLCPSYGSKEEMNEHRHQGEYGTRARLPIHGRAIATLAPQKVAMPTGDTVQRWLKFPGHC
ncbi:hypothetical protein ASPVEDRAFT_257942 [Aspergillus versicolor CBS 583.65]|uniref:Uncharacterized protein n=1 Tax=Aspergillus versicolor CBS 583.65 TaxID=1036611 RepID=A0A1L9P5T1_ASPVE|nr:uncharacterized protein ASPVEDRAFT_257942 [Aspergillus versicolor CBS 583.65]OJI96869.1 hypothetical protein ASPVEDRAFT_257942 [Aspergillus versicolor CBS 583.65]